MGDCCCRSSVCVLGGAVGAPAACGDTRTGIDARRCEADTTGGRTPQAVMAPPRLADIAAGMSAPRGPAPSHPGGRVGHGGPDASARNGPGGCRRLFADTAGHVADARQGDDGDMSAPQQPDGDPPATQERPARSSATGCPASCPTSTRTRPRSGSSRSTPSSTTPAATAPATSCSACWSGAASSRSACPRLRSTDYINTIPPEREPWFPGDEHIERRIRAYIRWNAAIMVHRAQRPGIGVGGHISTYASSASLYEVGFNHFFRGKDHPGGGDQIFFQGHASPGIYARAFLEGRLTEHQLDGFRQELSHPGGGLSSYPHPRLMPDFWEFPTVSMGLGPINAIYQARFNRYLHAPRHQGHQPTSTCGRSSATARWTSPSRSARSASPPARSWTTSPSSSTATCSASTARSAATARSSRSWSRSSAAPAGTSSR